MELYVCWGTFPVVWRPGGHPCRNAYEALKDAGWDPEVKKTYGLGPLPDAVTPQRQKVRELTGQNWVPVLVTDEGEVIRESKKIESGRATTPPAPRTGRLGPGPARTSPRGWSGWRKSPRANARGKRLGALVNQELTNVASLRAPPGRHAYVRRRGDSGASYGRGPVAATTT
jgi:hypothetical protein